MDNSNQVDQPQDREIGEQAIVAKFAEIRQTAVPVDRLFGTTGWVGEIDGMPVLVLSYYLGAKLVWFDDRWMQSQPFTPTRALGETLGIESW